jgi:hypothetical protein
MRQLVLAALVLGGCAAERSGSPSPSPTPLSEQAPAQAAPQVAPVKRARPLPVGVTLGALLALVLALLATLQLRPAPAEPRAEAPPVSVAPPPSFPSDRVFPPPTATPPGALAPTEGLVLDLTAKQECWVAVQADGVRVIDRVLAQGETQRLNAHREIVLSVGNAGGIAFRLNGRNGVALGKDLARCAATS